MSLSTFVGDQTVKVRLVGSRSRSAVVFNVSPDIVENRNVNYKSMDPIHMPGQIMVYQSTANRTINITSVKIVSRTKAEAGINLDQLNVLRSWTMPHFGNTGSEIEFGPLGAPPEVLFFSAYSNVKAQKSLYKIPTVLTNLSIPYPSDVDYIEADDDKTPFPTFMSIDLQLSEIHSPAEFSGFSLAKYKSGQLTNF